MRHLKDLREAGLTHVHLLPSYDFGSVPERAEDQQVPQVRRHTLTSWLYSHILLHSSPVLQLATLAAG